MNRGPRIVVLVAIVSIALLLHFGLCSWHWMGPYSANSAPVLGHFHDRTTDGISGIFSRSGVSRAEGLVYGVAVPLALFAAALHACLRWRVNDRVSIGACAGCGHRLDLGNMPRCPECGRVSRGV